MKGIFKDVLTGGTGIAAIQVANEMPVDDMVKVVTQLVIAVVTLIRMFKKNKKDKQQ